MAGYGGYFLQGMAQGVQQGFGMVQQAKEMKWKREQRAALKIQQDNLASAISNMQVKAKQLAEDGWTSQEVSDFGAMVHAGSIELQGHFKGYLEGIERGEKDRVESYKGLIDEWTKNLDDMDLSNMQTAYDSFSTQITDPDAKQYLETNYRMKQSTAKPAKQKVERFATMKEFHERYDVGTPFEYDKEGYLRPKSITTTKENEYQMKRKSIMANPNLSEDEKLRGIYKLETGLDISRNDDDADFTSPEGKRTLDLAFTTAFGYTIEGGQRVAGIVPSRLAMQLSRGRKATEEEKEAVMYDWNLRKAATLKLGGTMAVKAMEDILNQLFRETKPEEVIEGTLIDKARKYINEKFGTEEPTEETPVPKKIEPTVGLDSKIALIPTLTDDELKTQANAAAQEDVNSLLYKALYEECKKRGLLK